MLTNINYYYIRTKNCFLPYIDLLQNFVNKIINNIFLQQQILRIHNSICLIFGVFKKQNYQINHSKNFFICIKDNLLKKVLFFCILMPKIHFKLKLAKTYLL